MQKRLEANSSLRIILALIIVVLLIRVAAMAFAMTAESDAVERTWIGWTWLSKPEVITTGVWGPLHTYLIAFALAVGHDPVTAPILLHIIFSVAASIPLYFFVKTEFGSERGALFAAGAYLFYPIAMRNSLMATPGQPFVFFQACSMYCLALARQERGSWIQALAAGLLLTTAGMLRYEAWMLIPLFALLLWRKPGSAVVFVAAALIFPIFWMWGNYAATGDALYSIHWASNWELNVEQTSTQLNAVETLKRLTFYPLAVIFGMTPFVTALALVGAALTVIRRRPYALWIVPFIGLLAIYTLAAAQGSLTMKARYSVILAMLLFPFCAEIYHHIPSARFKNRQLLWVEAALIGTMLPLSYLGNLLPLELVQHFYETGINAVPRPQMAEQTQIISTAVNAHLDERTDGFITDFYRWDRTYYVAQMTRLSPDHIFVAPGAPGESLDENKLASVLDAYPTGLLLLKTDSSFAADLHAAGGSQVTFRGCVLALTLIESFAAENPDLDLYRYRVVAGNANAS